MSEELNPPVEEGSAAIAPETIKNVSTIIGLGGMAAAALAAEKYGLDKELPHVAKMAVDSCAHPLLGYAGAWAANALAGSPAGKFKTKVAAAGTTIANFTAEASQSLLVASPQYVDFMSSRNLPETSKDYLFALGGLGLFMLQNKRQKN